MKKSALVAVLCKTISDDFSSIPATEINENSLLYDDLYLDSILLMQLLAHIECELGIVIPDEVLNKNDFFSISKLADFLLRCKNGNQLDSSLANSTTESNIETEHSSQQPVEEFEDIKVHCFVSSLCEIIKEHPDVDHRPFYFGVWDAEIVIDDNNCINYHSTDINHDFFVKWYFKLYGVRLTNWYDQQATKENNIKHLLKLIEIKSDSERIMVMVDLYRLPERENKFNRNPFPHYVLLEKTDDPEQWLMSDPDFRWEGLQDRSQILYAIQSDSVAGGYLFDSHNIRPTSRHVIRDYFLECLIEDNNPLTDILRMLVQKYTSPDLLSIHHLEKTFSQLPVLAIRKYAYEHGLAYFWRDLNLNDQEFEYWCVIIDELVTTYKKIQYRVIKLSSPHSNADAHILICEINELLDQQDDRELQIKRRLKAVFNDWCHIHFPITPSPTSIVPEVVF